MSKSGLFSLSSFRKSTSKPDSAVPEKTKLLEDVNRLENIIVEKDSIISALEMELKRTQSELEQNTGIVKRQHPLIPVVHEVEDKKTKKTKMGRHASVTTSTILQSLISKELEEGNSSSPYQSLAERVVGMFRDPAANMGYLTSPQFASDIMHLCVGVCSIFEAEKRNLFLQSPVYIFGDIHGNLEDLHFFSDNIWKLGMHLTAGKFLFLGDYVDRGMNSLEVVGYLFALKIMVKENHPEKLFLLRGNHETRDVNGWEEHYGDRSFLYQSKDRFGDDLGETVWEACNTAFDRLPLSCVIDHDIFCVHGGIPRKVDGSNSRIQDILGVPNISSINPPNDLETEISQQVACDCIWSDPAHETQEPYLPDNGFGESLRGGGAICFGMNAISEFLEEQGLSYIVRAHEAHSEGVALSKGARVFTVFSTSKDHGQGQGAMAGCILVDFDQIHVINRSTAYKNKFVHRRGSLTLVGLPQGQIEMRERLGLVVHDPNNPAFQPDPDQDEEEVEGEYGDQMNDIDSEDEDGGKVGVVVNYAPTSQKDIDSQVTNTDNSKQES